MAEGAGRGRVLHLQDMPVDENGVRDVLQVCNEFSLCSSVYFLLSRDTKAADLRSVQPRYE